MATKRNKEPESLQEIHKIRELISKETVGMTVKEELAYLHRLAQEAEKRTKLSLRKTA